MSSSPLVQQVQTLISQMDQQERAQVRLLLDHFPGSGRVAASGKSPTRSSIPKADSDWLLDGILAELERRGMYYSVRVASVQGIQSLSKSYEPESASMRAKLREALKRELPEYRHQHLVALGRVAAGALADYRPPQAPLGLKYMLNNVGKLFEALDNSFPGYVQAGRVAMLVRTSTPREARQ